MGTPNSWFEARLKTRAGIVKVFQVAFLAAGVTTRKTVHTMDITATFRAKSEEIVGGGNGDRRVWMSRAFRCQDLPNVVVSSHHVDDGCPHADMT